MITVQSQLESLTSRTTENYLVLSFREPLFTLSSAVLNGGWGLRDHILNLRVQENFKGEKKDFPSPAATLDHEARRLGLKGVTTGLMTAASMNSLRHKSLKHQGIIIEAFLTSGLSNARRAGDPHDPSSGYNPGTINIILITNLRLTPSAMVEAIMMVTEAKAAVLQERNDLSPISGKIATGTGTDSLVVASGGGAECAYCGKHTLEGEMIANAVSDALKSSLDFC